MAAREGENGPGHNSVEEGSAGEKLGGNKRGREVEQPEVAPVDKKWPGWPGETVFRLIVPVQKTGSIIGRKGELIKKMCEETRARIKILEGVEGATDRVVLITGREEPDAPISPAMDGILRVHKRVVGIEGDGTNDTMSGFGMTLTRLLVPSKQAGSLIGKQGSEIKSIQETSGANVRVVPSDDLSFCALAEDRILEIQGEAPKVQKALEMVVGQLRKFLVDRTILPLFEKNPHKANGSQDLSHLTLGKWGKILAPPFPGLSPPLPSASQSGSRKNFTSTPKLDSFYPLRDTYIEPQSHQSVISLYGKDPGAVGLRSSLPPPAPAPVITQVIQKLQIPLSYADDVIGLEGTNIGYMRRASGATITIQETRNVPNEITIEIKGSTTQVQAAQQFIQNSMAGGHKNIPHSNAHVGYGSYGPKSSSLYSSPSLSSCPMTSSPPIGCFGSSYGSRYGY
uniref:K Homology domain-containing protein n=1 Tax=Araucaria cunninghamii TaxID=56994 RepID=A0A0D6QW69_ARACU